MNRGWVRLWAKSLDSPVFQDANLWKVWCWCLMNARRKPGTACVPTGRGNTLVELKPGQFIFGRHVAAKELKMPPSTVQDRMSRLGTMGNLVTQPGTHFSIVSICNWSEYQTDAHTEPVTQPVTQSSTNRQPTVTLETVREKEEKKKTNGVVSLRPDGVSEETWDAIKAHRRAKKAPLTTTALTTIQKQAEKVGWSLEDAFLEMINRGWSGFKAEWVKPKEFDWRAAQHENRKVLGREQ